MKYSKWTLPALVLVTLAGLALPHAARADDVTLNVPVRLTRMAANVTRGLVSCDVKGIWRTESARAGAAMDELFVRLHSTGTANFAIPASGDFNANVSVRVSTSPPPRAWIDAGNRITLDTTYYFCRVQVATADSAWQPPLSVIEEALGTGTIPRVHATFSNDPPAWASPGNPSSLIVSGPLIVTTPPR